MHCEELGRKKLTFLERHEKVLKGAAWCSNMEISRETRMTSKHRVSINLSPDEHRELDALAQEARISKAWLGRQAIIEFLDRYRDRKLQFPLDLSQPRNRRHSE